MNIENVFGYMRSNNVSNPKTDAERQKSSREGRVNRGILRKEYWATEEQHVILKEKLKELQNKA